MHSIVLWAFSEGSSPEEDEDAHDNSYPKTSIARRIICEILFSINPVSPKMKGEVLHKKPLL
jgi:hypothetical protein